MISNDLEMIKRFYLHHYYLYAYPKDLLKGWEWPIGKYKPENPLRKPTMPLYTQNMHFGAHKIKQIFKIYILEERS